MASYLRPIIHDVIRFACTFFVALALFSLQHAARATVIFGDAASDNMRSGQAGSGTANSAWNHAKNLARLNCGAQIDRILPGGRVLSATATLSNSDNPAALILEDNTLSCRLELGENVFIVRMPRITALERFAFRNENAIAEGEYEIATSNSRLAPGDARWSRVQSPTTFTGKNLVTLSMIGSEAKYVRLSFHVRKEGRLAAISLYGSHTLQNFADNHILQSSTAYEVAVHAGTVNLSGDALVFNFANQYARARVAYVSSGAATLSPRIIDDDVSTAYSFAPNDSHPTLFVELPAHQNIQRVSAVYECEAAQLDVYLLAELPADPASLTNLTPTASLTNLAGARQAAVNFRPSPARYLALRWSGVKSDGQPFLLSEVAGFSVTPLSVLNLTESPAIADLGPQKAGEGGPDFSNSLGTLADPPTVNPISP